MNHSSKFLMLKDINILKTLSEAANQRASEKMYDGKGT